MKLFDRDEKICPWWIAWTFDNPLRRVLHKPDEIFRGLVAEGQTVIDIGCGMGYFTMGLAKLVGPDGRVIAVDVQERMLGGVRKRAEREGLTARIRTRRCGTDSLGLSGMAADFILAFWMVHEVKDREGFLREVSGLMKPGAHFLVAEPRMHVSAKNVQRTVELAQAVGLTAVNEPRIGWSRAVLFRKGPSSDPSKTGRPAVLEKAA